MDTRRTADAGDRGRPTQPWRVTRKQQPPSQGWKTFLAHPCRWIASINLFAVRTIFFKLLYGLVIFAMREGY